MTSIQVGDTVTHVDEGFWKAPEVVTEIIEKSGEKYARFKDGGFWILSSLTKMTNSGRSDEV